MSNITKPTERQELGNYQITSTENYNPETIEDLKDTFCDIEGGKENFMEEYGISIYALNILTNLGFDESKALSILAQMKNKDRIRDVDIFMKNGVYEEIAVQILVEMKKKEKNGNFDKYEIFNKYGISEADATNILKDIDLNNLRKQRKELEWKKAMEKHRIEGDKVSKILDKINKLFKVDKRILDSFANDGISEENALKAIDELYSSNDDRVAVLKHYGISEYGIQNILEEINQDELRKFSPDKHEKEEKYYAEVFPEHYWDSLSLYQKEEIAKQLDFIISVIGENKKIRVYPQKIRSLRNTPIMPRDLKGGAYDSDAVYVRNLSDLYNLCLLHHESIHLEQQQELRIPGLNKISLKAANKLGYYTWVAAYTAVGGLFYIIRHLNFGKVTYSIISENEAYGEQGNFGYLNDRPKFATFKNNLGERAKRKTRKAVEKYNYRLEIKEGNYYEKLSKSADKLQEILENNTEFFNGEEHEKLLKIKAKLENLVGRLSELHEEEINGGEANLEKWDELGYNYLFALGGIINISDDLLKLLKEERKIVEGVDRDFVNKIIIAMEEISDIKRDARDIKHDLAKNSSINNSTENLNKNYNWYVWNYVYKINDIRNVVSILEEKIEQLEDFKDTGKNLSEFEMTPELREKRDLCISALANENALYLMYDKIDGEKCGFNPSFDASYSNIKLENSKDSELSKEKNLEAINKTIRFIEKTIKNLNIKCHEYEKMATKIWLEEPGHKLKSYAKAMITSVKEKSKLSKEEIIDNKNRKETTKKNMKLKKKLMGIDPVKNLMFPNALGEK